MAAIIMGLRGGGNIQKFKRANMSGDDEGAEKSAVNTASNTEELTTPMPSENDCLFSGDIAKCPLYSDSPEWRSHFCAITDEVRPIAQLVSWMRAWACFWCSAVH